MFQRFLILAFFALTLIHIAQTGTATEFVNENPKHPGKCWLESHQRALAIGETWQLPNSCATRTCSKNYDGRPGYIVTHFSCGIATINGVRVVPSNSKPYPQCCMG